DERAKRRLPAGRRDGQIGERAVDGVRHGGDLLDAHEQRQGRERVGVGCGGVDGGAGERADAERLDEPTRVGTAGGEEGLPAVVGGDGGAPAVTRCRSSRRRGPRRVAARTNRKPAEAAAASARRSIVATLSSRYSAPSRSTTRAPTAASMPARSSNASSSGRSWLPVMRTTAGPGAAAGPGTRGAAGGARTGGVTARASLR